MRNRRRAFRFGRTAELRAVWWYRLRGYRVLARNVRVGGGEIDLIVRRFGTVAFVEVKARGDGAWEHPALAVNSEKRARIIRAARAWRAAGSRAIAGCTFRYDVVCVTIRGFRTKVEVFTSAFVEETGADAVRRRK